MLDGVELDVCAEGVLVRVLTIPCDSPFIEALLASWLCGNEPDDGNGGANGALYPWLAAAAAAAVVAAGGTVAVGESGEILAAPQTLHPACGYSTNALMAGAVGSADVAIDSA